MGHFSLHLRNETKFWYHFGVYGQYPVSPGLGSLMWRHCGVPPGEDGFSAGLVEWDATIGVAIASYDEATREYSTIQKISAELGKCYVAVAKSGIRGIDSTPLQGVPCDPQQVKVVNRAQGPLDLGFTLGGELFKVNRDVSGGEIVSYVVDSSVPRAFYVAAFRQVDIDEDVSSVLAIPPVKLRFKDGNNSAEVKAVEDAGMVKLTAPVYSSVQSTDAHASATSQSPTKMPLTVM